MAKFYKVEDNKVIYTGSGELIYYVPEKYFDVSAAVVIGEYVEVMGIFSYCNFTKTGAVDGGIKPFKCPTMIKCMPSSIERVNNYTLEGSKEPATYRLLHFKEGSELLSSTAIPKDVDNVDKFVKLWIRGNLPDTIPYNEFQDYIIKNADLNGFSYKVSNQIIGLMISELCRDADDLTKPFRLSDMKDMQSYKAITITKVPKYTSPYTAITSENPDEALAAAIMSTGNAQSPLEKVMMN